jgi:hypothetical protein
MPLSLEEIRQMAKLGIEGEIARLQGLLAQLEASAPESMLGQPSEPRPKRTRRPMTAAEKKALGIRMKAIWAAKRKGARQAAP